MCLVSIQHIVKHIVKFSHFIYCFSQRLPRKMTTFGVDFHQHLAATKRKDIPYIIEKCIETINEHGLAVKVLMLTHRIFLLFYCIDEFLVMSFVLANR